MTMPTASHAKGVFQVASAGDTFIGTRENNEDTLLVRADLGLSVLADGAGGPNAGEVASNIATKAIADSLESTANGELGAAIFEQLGLLEGARRLSAAVHAAHRAVVKAAHESDLIDAMSTTVVAVLADPLAGIIHIAHVGDSRCYRLRQGSLGATDKRPQPHPRCARATSRHR